MGGEWSPALAAAFVAANREIENVSKTGNNKHLKSSYVKLEQIVADTRPILATHGLAIAQPLTVGEDGGIVITTMLIHESGESFSSVYRVPRAGDQRGVNSHQAMGIGISYGRRYALMSLLNLGAEDSDGETGKRQDQRPQRQQPQPKTSAPTKDWKPVHPASAEPTFVSDSDRRKFMAWVGDWKVEGKPLQYEDLCSFLEEDRGWPRPSRMQPQDRVHFTVWFMAHGRLEFSAWACAEVTR